MLDFGMLQLLEESTETAADYQPYMILLPLALILFSAKVFGLLAERIHLPQVIGFLGAGLLIGLLTFLPDNLQVFFNDYTKEGLNFFGKIGVVLILFTAGLETDLKKIRSVGLAAVIITSLGVIAPLVLGGLVAWAFFPKDDVYSNIYYGVILTATSVSITVATLKELGKLDSRFGTAIVSAAIIDDVIGIILLSLVLSLAGGDSGTTYVPDNTALNILVIVLVMLGFFALSFIVGFLIKKLFNWLGNKYPHHIRIPIFSLAFCFFWAYIAEHFFQIADITGGYVAGLILSTVSSDVKHYIDHRAVTTANLIFTPVFFVMIALSMYEPGALNFSDLSFVWFGICWVLAGLASKVIGAGIGGLISKFSFRDSLTIGVGMMARAEVVIVCAQKGIDAGIVSPEIMPFTLVLIILSSFVTPIFLKLLIKQDPSSLSAPLSVADKKEGAEVSPSK